MKIEWKNSNEYYHSKLATNLDKKEGVKQLILKILELSESKDNWNTIVLDKWVFNLGRLIGNIQNTEEAIGMDRGYRVAIQFLEYYDKLENSSKREYNEKLDLINEEMEDLIFDVLEDKDFKIVLKRYHKLNPFDIEISEQGQRIGIRLSVV